MAIYAVFVCLMVAGPGTELADAPCQLDELPQRFETIEDCREYLDERIETFVRRDHQGRYFVRDSSDPEAITWKECRVADGDTRAEGWGGDVGGGGWCYRDESGRIIKRRKPGSVPIPCPPEHATIPMSASHNEDSKAGYYRQVVYYATDRALVSGKRAEFGYDRDERSMHYGSCVVTIPPVHRRGDLEQPQWYRLEFSEDPRKDITLQETKELSLEALRTEVDRNVGSTLERRMLVFVHGYNVTFAEAAKRTGQLAWDLDLRGPNSRGLGLFYSWPSRGEAAPYLADETNAEWAKSDLEAFLIDLLSTTTAKDIYIIAHSMGSRPTLRAIAEIARSSRSKLLRKVHGLILAAPDIDASTFRKDIAPNLASMTGTLYVSSKDRPLYFSMRAHGGYPRLGDPAAGPIVVKGFDTLDASAVDDGDFLGHSYFAGRPALLEDIFNLMNGIVIDERFGLSPVATKGGRYWKFDGIAP